LVRVVVAELQLHGEYRLVEALFSRAPGVVDHWPVPHSIVPHTPESVPVGKLKSVLVTAPSSSLNRAWTLVLFEVAVDFPCRKKL
jgi:hypothetical protein